MKIGILTFHRALNYGAVLQCYALFVFLRQMGHDVEVIDYRPWCIEKDRKDFDWRSFKTRSFLQKLKYISLFPSRSVFRRKSSKVFDVFLKSNLKFSCPVVTARDIPSYYDAIIFGSDQIWSPIICKELNAIYYGQFTKGSTRFLSYAASLEGYKDFTPQQWDTIASYLNTFDAISVREKSVRDALATHLSHQVEWVVDPTLLIDSALLKNLVKVKPAQRYVLLFTAQDGTMPYHIAQHIAKENKCGVIRMRTSARLNWRNKEKNVHHIYAASPERFVEYISNATCVVTNSFHATAISLQLKKDFVAVECKHPNRIVDLLHSLDLTDRYVTTIDDLNHVKSIDYEKVHSRIKDLSSASRTYLTMHLQ